MRVHPTSLLLTFALACLPSFAAAQTQPPHESDAAQLSPQAAYAEALHPLEVTRHNIANWSDVELAAMNVAIAKAKAACQARSPETTQAPDLVDLARLCSLGQEWASVVAAASRYIASPLAPKPLLPDAYVAQTEARLRLKQEPAALQSALEMLKAVPYTTDVGDCIDEALGYMRFVHTADALTLAEARQALLLDALRVTPAPQSAPANTAAPATMSASVLYAQGLLLPALQQLAAMPAAAGSSVTALDAALPTKLSSDDTLLVAKQRRRYALLGKPLTGIHPMKSLSMPNDALPALPANSAITAMLLFPDWCAQCVHLGSQLPLTVFTVEGHSAYLYALLAETLPPRKPDPKITNTAFSPAYAAALLAETPTVTVPVATLSRFEADDFPLLLLTDTRGVLRVLQPVGAQDLQPGGDVDAAIALVGRNFNTPHPPAPATQAAAPHR